MHLLLGISCFLSSVLVAVLVVFATWALFSRLGTAKLEQIRAGNSAAAVLLGAELLAFGILMTRCLYPVSAVLQNLFLGSGLGALKSVLVLIGYIVLGYALSVLTVALAAQLFKLLSRDLDENAEIRAGNLAAAIVFGMVIVTIAFMVQSGLGDLLNTLIPPFGGTKISFQA
ncbi:DUF350 domain-containing protein [Kiritimatiella glycovorans]|uniref:Putative membrane protein n=1 Tax=Kiritimatiella glycovorans TaxID=1307763 RepID=A0A0G3EH47_9BACT|nr:DUF350 domain-containing protein [Kiritimatiella glycovorans]AKJ63459.1 putative membrane protein [Kiritimatiella glycovorans]